jgi:hypothetical protein
MDEKIVQELLHELFSSLETLETRSTAILQFLKDKGIANEKELGPYFETAGNASGVRWLAARVRMEHLLAGAMKSAEQAEPQKVTQNSQEASAATDKAPVDTEKGRDREGEEGGKTNKDAERAA